MDPFHFEIRDNWLTRRIDSRSAAVAALISLILVFAALLNWNGLYHADIWMPASGAAVFGKHEYWRAWSTLFVHADLRHLLANSFLFFILGTFIYGYFGLVAFPFLALFCGGLANLVVLRTMRPETELIGVSGVVYWMGGFWLILYFLIERRLTVTQRALRAFGVGLVLFMPAEAFDPTISYADHLTGFIFGLIAGLAFYLYKRREILSAEIHELVMDE